MSCKCNSCSFLSLREFANTTIAAVARRSSVASVTTLTTINVPPPLTQILASAHSDARRGLLLNALSLAAPSSLACSSRVRSRFVNAKLKHSMMRLTKRH